MYISYRVFHALTQQNPTPLPNTLKSANTAKYFLLTFYKMTILILGTFAQKLFYGKGNYLIAGQKRNWEAHTTEY